jgi:hypothetical protein
MEVSFQVLHKRFLFRSAPAIPGKRMVGRSEFASAYPAAAVSRASPLASMFRRNYQRRQTTTQRKGLNNNSWGGGTL